MTLSEFLIARVEEEERDLGFMTGHDGWYPEERYWADCEVKRQIVKLVDDTDAVDIHVDGWSVAQTAARIVALPYADHPDYRVEWKP